MPEQVVTTRRKTNRAVYVPYAVLLLVVMLLGFADDQTFRGVWPYSVFAAAFVVQAVYPTIWGWGVALTGWLALWTCAVTLAVRGRETAGTIALVVVLATLSMVPLVIFRPRISRSGEA